MAALGDRDMAAGPIGRIVGGMAVVRCHCVPEVLNGRCDSAFGSAWPRGRSKRLSSEVTYCCAMMGGRVGKSKRG